MWWATTLTPGNAGDASAATDLITDLAEDHITEARSKDTAGPEQSAQPDTEQADDKPGDDKPGDTEPGDDERGKVFRDPTARHVRTQPRGRDSWVAASAQVGAENSTPSARRTAPRGTVPSGTSSTAAALSHDREGGGLPSIVKRDQACVSKWGDPCSSSSRTRPCGGHHAARRVDPRDGDPCGGCGFHRLLGLRPYPRHGRPQLSCNASPEPSR